MPFDVFESGSPHAGHDGGPGIQELPELAGQPHQSQPRRRNSNTRMTPTMSISTITAG
jgi:hypothetical protein